MGRQSKMVIGIERLLLFVLSYKDEVEEGDGSDIDHHGEEHYKGEET